MRMVCDVCGVNRTRVGCFICERPVCARCHDNTGTVYFCAQPGDRVCSKRCRRQYKLDKRERLEEPVKPLSRRALMMLAKRERI